MDIMLETTGVDSAYNLSRAPSVVARRNHSPSFHQRAHSAKRCSGFEALDVSESEACPYA